MHVGCTVYGHLYRGGFEYIYLGLGDESVYFLCMGVTSDSLVFVGACVLSSLAS